jgi:hypothetical protein
MAEAEMESVPTAGAAMEGGERVLDLAPRRHLEIWLPLVVLAFDQSTNIRACRSFQDFWI